MEKRGYIVKGIVQGVGFRYFVLRVARSLGLKGYVKNLYDGSVEVVAIGDNDSLNVLEKELKKGPPMAVVYSVDRFTPLSGVEEFDGFEIKY